MNGLRDEGACLIFRRIFSAAGALALLVAIDAAGAQERLAERIVPLLRHDDATVRVCACSVIGELQARERAAAVAELLDETVMAVVREAISTLGTLQATQYAGRVAEFLRDVPEPLRRAAARSLGQMGARAQADEVAELLHDRNLLVARVAGMALERIGRKEHADLAQKLLREGGTRAAWGAAFIFRGLATREHLWAVRRLLAHPYREVRCLAAQALARIEPGSRAARKILADDTCRDTYAVEAREAMGDTWEKECGVPDLLAAVRQHRIVLIGEMHTTPSMAPFNHQRMMLAQERIMRAVNEAGEGRRFLGYETCARELQEKAIQRAEKWNWTVLPLEPEKEKHAGWRVRDRNVAASIRRVLDEHPAGRLVAIYGAHHVTGRRHVGDLLERRHLVIVLHSRLYWRIAADEGRLDLADRVYKIRDGVYYWPVEEPFRPLAGGSRLAELIRAR